MNPETWRVLLVEDDQVDRIAVRRALVAAPVPIKLDEVERASEVLERLRTPPGEAPYDCLLIDCYLPDSSGVELIQSLRKQGITTPILAVTGQDDEATEEALLAAGASDYMPKQDWRPDRLTRRIRHAIRIGRMETNYAAALAAAKSAVRATRAKPPSTIAFCRISIRRTSLCAMIGTCRWLGSLALTGRPCGRFRAYSRDS